MGSSASRLKSRLAKTSSPAMPSSPPSESDQTTTTTPAEYTFPQDKLQRRLTNPDKTPLVLVAVGSFSPITVLHLQLFELAHKNVDLTDFEIVGNYMSPCSDTYGKSSLVAAQHRIEMCKLGIEESHVNVMIDEWETMRRDGSGRPLYTPTCDVFKRFDEQINDVLGGIQTTDGKFVRARVMMLIGADLALTMSDPKVWPTSDIDILLGHYGAFIVERPAQCDTQKAIEPLSKYRDNIWVLPSFPNDVSSTKVRSQLQNGETAMDVPKSVFEYIKSHHLYEKTPVKANASEQTNGTSNNDLTLPCLPVSSHR